jgi:N utilization substance protein B
VPAVARREARERAISLLYEAEAKTMRPADLLAELPVPPDPFTIDLVAGVGERLAEIDRLIAEHSIGWSVDRMPAMDRAVLRMAAFELVARPDIPTGAVLSEAVELAGVYGTDESSRFVNGVLAALARECRGP